jgi:hypothetical protein
VGGGAEKFQMATLPNGIKCGADAYSHNTFSTQKRSVLGGG